jgi:RNA polymerase sigma-70 factor (sigma-E family)
VQTSLAAPVTGPPPTLAEFAAANTVGLTRFAYLLCGDRGLAEDLVQDAFAALYRRFGESLPVAAPVAYARRVIANANTSRGRRRGVETVAGELPERAVDAVDHGEQDAMWRALATLPVRQRTVLVCRYYLGFSDAEIADLLHAREGTVRSLAARAFAALRQHPDLPRPGGKA